jgi:hypothetical protein
MRSAEITSWKERMQRRGLGKQGMRRMEIPCSHRTDMNDPNLVREEMNKNVRTRRKKVKERKRTRM